MMAEKAKLTLETALAEFPEECETVLGEATYAEILQDIAKQGDMCEWEESHLGWSAIYWLFARNNKDGIRWMPGVWIDPGHPDPLRWTLGEVTTRLATECMARMNNAVSDKAADEKED